MSLLKQIHPLMLLYQLGFVFVVATVLMMFGFGQGNAIFNAVLLYFILFYIMRSLLTYNHRMGIRSYRKNRLEEAIDYFHSSGNFFEAHPGLDRYRFAVLFSVSRLSYRELAETNAGFCYIRLGKLAKAEKSFERAKEINPYNPLAPSALQAIRENKE